MTLYQKRNEILRSARQAIVHYGISALRVEEIARMMGISKRTIYRIFPTKADLLKECIMQMIRQQQEKMLIDQDSQPINPWERLFIFLQKYIDTLYQAESVFLREMKQLPDFRDIYLEIRGEWINTMKFLLKQCKQEGYILLDTDTTLFCERLLTTLFESRVEEELPYMQQLVFCRTILRGIATDLGRTWLESQ